MNDFPWTPQHGQPADADGFIDEAEASEAAQALATAKQIASEAGRILEMHQQQEKAGDEVVVDKPATKKAASRTRATKAKSKKATN